MSSQDSHSEEPDFVREGAARPLSFPPGSIGDERKPRAELELWRLCLENEDDVDHSTLRMRFAKHPEDQKNLEILRRYVNEAQNEPLPPALRRLMGPTSQTESLPVHRRLLSFARSGFSRRWFMPLGGLAMAGAALLLFLRGPGRQGSVFDDTDLPNKAVLQPQSSETELAVHETTPGSDDGSGVPDGSGISEGSGSRNTRPLSDVGAVGVTRTKGHTHAIEAQIKRGAELLGGFMKPSSLALQGGDKLQFRVVDRIFGWARIEAADVPKEREGLASGDRSAVLSYQVLYEGSVPDGGVLPFAIELDEESTKIRWTLCNDASETKCRRGMDALVPR